MDSINFNQIVKDVTITWGKVKEIHKYETKVGSLLFRTIFQKYPEVFESFSFGGEYRKMKLFLFKAYNGLSTGIPEQEASRLYHHSQEKPTPEQMHRELLNNGYDYEKDPRLVKHGKRWVRAFSLAIDMLGPDLDVIKEEFMELGERHTPYEVTEEQYRIMGTSLLETLEIILGKQVFNEQIKQSWAIFFSFVSKTMVKGMQRQYAPLKIQRPKHRRSSSLPPPSSTSSSSTSSSSLLHRRRKPIIRTKSHEEMQRQQQTAAVALADYRQKIMERRLPVCDEKQ